MRVLTSCVIRIPSRYIPLTRGMSAVDIEMALVVRVPLAETPNLCSKPDRGPLVDILIQRILDA